MIIIYFLFFIEQQTEMHFNPFRLLFLQFYPTNLMMEMELELIKFWFIHGIHSSNFDSSIAIFLSFIWVPPVGDGKMWNILEKEKPYAQDSCNGFIPCRAIGQF